MNYKHVKPTKRIENKEIYASGANVADNVAYYECFCGKGVIEYHNTPGFDDSFFVIECPLCKKKYRYIEWCGYEWRVYK